MQEDGVREWGGGLGVGGWGRGRRSRGGAWPDGQNSKVIPDWRGVTTSSSPLPLFTRLWTPNTILLKCKQSLIPYD